MEQIRRIMRPTDVPDTGMYLKTNDLFLIFYSSVISGLLCDLLW
jgi:hypothetical protein